MSGANWRIRSSSDVMGALEGYIGVSNLDSTGAIQGALFDVAEREKQGRWTPSRTRATGRWPRPEVGCSRLKIALLVNRLSDNHNGRVYAYNPQLGSWRKLPDMAKGH